MNTIKQLLKQAPVFLHNFKDKIDVIGNFENISMTSAEYNAGSAPYPNTEYWVEEKARLSEKIKQWEGINILFASYGQDNYTGDAWVLFEKDGQLFEVNGSHCSCMGLEDQWKPEPVILGELKTRLSGNHFGKDTYSDNEFADELKRFLGL